MIRGTRVPIVGIIGGFAGGITKEEIIREYEVTSAALALDLIQRQNPNARV